MPTYTYTPLDDPAGLPGTTQAYGINTSGQIVGTYSLGPHKDYGFLYSGGTYATLIDPASAQETFAEGINDGGQVVGFYLDASGTRRHGFLYNGTAYATIDDSFGINGTTAEGINNAGQIVGFFLDSTRKSHGFLFSGGSYFTIDGPSGAQSDYTSGLNNAGQIVGAYYDANGVSHGFIFYRNNYTILDDPLASTAGGGGTQALGINDAGQVVGQYLASDGLFHGFLYSNGAYVTIDDPAAEAGGTDPQAINDAGQIVGSYTTNGGGIHGFLLTVTPDPIPPPAATTADMILRHGADGKYEIYDIGNNAILTAYQLGQFATNWQFSGLGGFNGADTTDMLLRNSSGGFEVCDVANNVMTNAAFMGTVGMDWQVMGFGNFASFGETDMILRNVNSGGIEVYDIHNNQITGANFMGTVGLDWQVAGFGNFSSRGTSDMILRNTNTGGLEVYDINSNQITGAAFMGTVGLDWKTSGFGNFSGKAGETDMLLRNVNTGGLEVYDIANNQITNAAFLGTIGLDWQFAGVAPIHAAGASDLVLRNVSTGAFEVYDIAGNQITGASSLGSVGLDWQLGGFAADAPAASSAAMGGADLLGSTSQFVSTVGSAGGGGAAPSLTAASVANAIAPTAKSREQTVLDAGLLALYQNGSATAAPPGGAASFGASSFGVAHAPNAISGDGRYVTIDAIAADGNGATLLVQLQAIGLEHGASFKGMASGLLPVDKVGALPGISDLAHASESGMMTHAGLVTSESDASMHADTARSIFGVDGTGIKVGVLSDSFATVASPITTMGQDIANGDLPADTTILQDFSNAAMDQTDEGRAMVQIIHDSAPGASIAFATANFGQANFANNIIALANAGAKVIVDDVQYFAEPMFQDGVIAQAVNQVVANGAIYFSSAGNEGHAGYEAPFINGGTGILGGLTETFHDFGTTVSGVPSTLLQINQTRDTTYSLQWANAAASASPGVGAITDLDFAGYSDPAGTNEIFHFTNNELGGDPINDLTLNGAQTFYLRVGLTSGPAPAALKIVAQDRRVTYGANTTNINDGTVYGHNSATGAIAVAAADYRRTPAFAVSPPAVESFSSGGPTNIWVNAAGQILSSPQVRLTPAIAAPDGVNTSFFGDDTTGADGDADSFPNFFGTSAAAPAAAAIAALLLQQRPGLSMPYLRSLLMNFAIDMDGATGGPFDFNTGAGLIQADKALNPVVPSPPGGTTAAMILRHGADGLYEIYNLGDNTALAGNLLGQVGPEWAFVTLAGFNGRDTSGMLLRGAATGGFEVYDIVDNNITDAAFLGTVGLDWQVMGFGNFASRAETDMILRNVNSGEVQVYDIRNNAITDTALMGTIGTDWQFSGVGNFGGRGTSDMLLRNANNGGLEVYNISSNAITNTALLGTVGLDWQFSGVGNFSGVAGGADLLLRNANTGGLEVYNIAGNQITGASFLGAIGLEWQFAGVAPVRAAGVSDLVLRNVNTGAFEVYNIANNQITGAASLAQVGPEWQLGGIAPDFSALSSSVGQLLQAMAGFGGNGAADSLNTVALAADTSQQPSLTTSQHV
jgi:probable HAF family extracellular repeat protein